ncbi:MAG: hypothetical protein QXW10_01695 [Candidatus Micrarchaeaceae archaeon]
METYLRIEKLNANKISLPFSVLRDYYGNNSAINKTFRKVEQALRNEKVNDIIGEMENNMKELRDIRDMLKVYSARGNAAPKEINLYITWANNALRDVVYLNMWINEFNYVDKNEVDKANACMSEAKSIAIEIAKLAGATITEKKISIF